MLASIDMDKQPVSLLETSRTSKPGVTITRKFTKIRSDSTYNGHEATMEQDEIHESYRKNFNTLDKHNVVRQGGACVETTWLTHK